MGEQVKHRYLLVAHYSGESTVIAYAGDTREEALKAAEVEDALWDGAGRVHLLDVQAGTREMPCEYDRAPRPIAEPGELGFVD